MKLIKVLSEWLLRGASRRSKVQCLSIDCELNAVLTMEVEPAVAATAASWQMVIVLGRDPRVIVDAGVDAAALARVLQVLEGR